MGSLVRTQLMATLLVVLWTKLAMWNEAREQLFRPEHFDSEPHFMSWVVYALDLLHQDLTVCALLFAASLWIGRKLEELAGSKRGQVLITGPALALGITLSAYHSLAVIYWWHYSTFPSKSILSLWNHLPIALEEAASEASSARWAPIMAGSFLIHLVCFLFRRPMNSASQKFRRTEFAQVMASILLGLLLVCWATSTRTIWAMNQNPLLSLVLVPSLEDFVENCPASFEGTRQTEEECPTPSSRLDSGPVLRSVPRRIVVYLWESMPYGAVFDATGACRIPQLAALQPQMVSFERLYTVQPMSFPSMVSLLTGAYSPGGLKFGAMASWITRHAPDSPLTTLRRQGWKLRAASSSIEDHAGYRGFFEAMGFEPLVSPAKGAPYRAHTWGVEDRFLFETARRWLTEEGETPQFILLIGSATHHPYHYDDDPAPGLSAKKKHSRLTMETGALAAGFYEWMQRGARDEETLFLVVGDHGEAFGEHEDNWIHGGMLYEENTRVAGFLLHPTRQGLPTAVRDVLSMTDLLRVLLGLPAKNPGFALSLHPLVPGRLSLVKEGKKLLVDLALEKREFYDLEVDPGEKHDLSQEYDLLADCYQQMLAERFRAVGQGWR